MILFSVSKDIHLFEFSVPVLSWFDWKSESEDISFVVFTFDPYFSTMSKNYTS